MNPSDHRKPALSFWQIWNMCFGFLGIQFGFALQNANASRIFQTLGADAADIPMLWIAAPLTGLLVQPLIGYASDRTWSRLGRRRPYFLAGAVFTTLALAWMPHAGALWIAAGLLWIMDASINVSMEPFRAFVGDQLPLTQRPLGYSMQSFFIGVGAIIASLLPWLLERLGVSNTATSGEIPSTVRYAFYIGAAVLLGAVLWTVFSTREYPPAQLQNHAEETALQASHDTTRAWRPGVAMLLIGLLVVLTVRLMGLEKELYLMSSGLMLMGLLFVWLSRTRKRRGMAYEVLADLYAMPQAMRRLAWVQFFSWFALFAMWVDTTPAVAQRFYGSGDPHSAAYNAGANWVGVLFAGYNGFAAVAAILIPLMVRRCGLRLSHLINLWLGAAGLASFVLIRDPHWLLLSMLGIGVAWASILSLPYALLSGHLPAAKMGVYMGIFNFFIVIPQLLAASVLGIFLKHAFHGQVVDALLLGSVSLFIAGLCALRVDVDIQR